jgi:heme-degrading monooxygenase HmoA
MIKIDTLDPSTPLASQFQEKTGSVVVINTFIVPREAMAQFLEIWHDDASVMKASPGFISTQLLRGTSDSKLVVNIGVWESTEALARAHSNPKFRENASKFPAGIVAYPHIYQKIAVQGVCVA